MKVSGWMRPGLVALVAALVSYWLSGGFRAGPPPSAQGTPPAPAMLPPALPPLPAPVSAADTLTFLQKIRSGSPAELRRAFAATREHSLRCAIIARWAALDGADCWNFLRRDCGTPVSHSSNFAGYLPVLFDQWARADPAAARDAAAGTDPALRIARSAMVASCAAQGGAAWRALLDDPRYRFADLTNVTAPPLLPGADAAVNVMRSAAEAERSGRFDLVRFSAWPAGAKADETAVLAVWRDLPRETQRSFTQAVFHMVAPGDPAKAAAFLKELPAVTREAMASTLTSRWSQKDPAASWAWIMENTQGARMQAAHQWANVVDRAAGAKILEAAPPSTVRDYAAADVTIHWLESKPADAMAWISGLSDPVMKKRVFDRGASGWALVAPERAVALLTAPGAPVLSASACQAVTRTLAGSRPELARQYVSTLPQHLRVLAENPKKESK